MKANSRCFVFDQSLLEKLDRDRTVQLFVERFLVRWVQNCIAETGVRKVALSGGVFMNVKANQKILNLPEVEELFVFPSCGDETNSIGAAWLLDQQLSKKAPDKLGPFYLGPEYSDTQIETALRNYKFKNAVETNNPKDVECSVAELLAKGCVVARFKGRMEFGARALGNRSILANPAAPGVVNSSDRTSGPPEIASRSRSTTAKRSDAKCRSSDAPPVAQE